MAGRRTARKVRSPRGGASTVKDLLGGRRAFVIAEAGTAHNGSLKAGRELIDAAWHAGAAAVKFQWVIAREILHPRTGAVDLPGGSIPLFEKFRSLERPASFYRSLQAHCQRRGILFLCTPFGPESARLLGALKPRAVKIASPELNFRALLAAAAGQGKPLIISTGVTTFEDLVKLRRRLWALGVPAGQAQMLHCVTQYPAREMEYNLLLLATLHRDLRLGVGLSDHTTDPHFLPLLAYTVCALTNQAFVLEKHFTLDKRGAGLDDPIAIDPEELTGLLAGLGALVPRTQDFLRREPLWRKDFTRALEARGAVMKRIARDFAQRLLPEYDGARIAAALGDGVKRLAPCEAPNYHTTRRSLRAIRPIAYGERLSSKNTAWLRSEKNLAPGLPAGEAEIWGLVTATRSLADGEAIREGDFTPVARR